MERPRQYGLMPSFEVVGYHVTKRPGSLTRYDLRIDGRNGVITADDISIDEAQAFIKYFERLLLHNEPEPPAAEGVPSSGETPRPDEPPADANGVPGTDPPPTGPEPAAAPEPLAIGGWLPPGTATQVTTAMVTAGEYALPGLPPGGMCYSGEWSVPAPGNPWPPLPGRQAQYEVRFDPAGPLPATHVMPQVVHLKPGETISIACSCRTIAGGALADDPNCRMHHGAPTMYVFDAR
jgi:hypothetical protein